MNKIIYLSPHLDDAVLSCGAIIWDQVHRLQKTVEIWTVFAGDPSAGNLSPFAKELHARWLTPADASAQRRKEDELACQRLGCTPVHLLYSDCIYRSRVDGHSPRVLINADLFAYDAEQDEPISVELRRTLQTQLPADSELVLPLGVGNHIDHIITRMAAEGLGLPCLYYADYPYAGWHPEEVSKAAAGMKAVPMKAFSVEALQAWYLAVAAYTSQISSFWLSMGEMEKSLRTYGSSRLDAMLWRPSSHQD
jgi:LmbE family N-acetylglucosaminyl deacetylase